MSQSRSTANSGIRWQPGTVWFSKCGRDAARRSLIRVRVRLRVCGDLWGNHRRRPIREPDLAIRPPGPELEGEYRFLCLPGIVPSGLVRCAAHYQQWHCRFFGAPDLRRLRPVLPVVSHHQGHWNEFRRVICRKPAPDDCDDSDS